MQAGIAAWVARLAHGSGCGLREHSPTMLLSLVCAAAVCPLLAAGAGITDATVTAGIGLLSSVGSNALSDVITSAIGRLRERRNGSPEPADLEPEIAQELSRLLAKGDENAAVLRTEINALFDEIDARDTLLRAAIETGNERVSSDVIAAVVQIGFSIDELSRDAREIKHELDKQGAESRQRADLFFGQQVAIRLVLDQLLGSRTGAGAGGCRSRQSRPEKQAEADH
jgi:hypothetical protein